MSRSRWLCRRGDSLSTPAEQPNMPRLDFLIHFYQSSHTIFDIHDTFVTIWMFEIRVGPIFHRRKRKSRQATRGVLLNKLTQSMGTRLPILVLKGNKRPHDPLQAAKFALEAGVVVTSQVPIFLNWKHYEGQQHHFYEYMYTLSVSMQILCSHSSLPWAIF